MRTLNFRQAFSFHLLLSMSMLAACSKQDAGAGAGAHSMPPPEVNVVTVQARELPVDFEYVGQTAGVYETEVRARITGILENRLYEEGSRVKVTAELFSG